jgi:methyl-accepting chemotaxis protein
LCLCLISLSSLLESTRVVVEQAPLIAQTTIHAEMSYLRADLRQQIKDSRRDANAHMSNVIKLTDKHLQGFRDDTNLNVTQLRGDINLQLDAANNSLAEMAALRSDIQPTIKTVNELSPSMMRNTLGVLAATKVTMGETAQAVKKIDEALPEFIAAAQLVANNSTKASDATAKAADNIQKVTSPIPRWLSIPFSIAVPISQIAFPWVTFWAR